MFDYSFDIFLAKFASEFNALIRPFSWVWFRLFEHFQENCVFYWESLILLLIFIVDLNSDGRCWFFSRLFGSGSHWRCYCLADWLHLVVLHWHHSHLWHLIWDHHHRVLHLWYLIWHHHHWLALGWLLTHHHRLAWLMHLCHLYVLHAIWHWLVHHHFGSCFKLNYSFQQNWPYKSILIRSESSLLFKFRK